MYMTVFVQILIQVIDAIQVLRFAGPGDHDAGCHSSPGLPFAECFHGVSLGSLRMGILVFNVGASSGWLASSMVLSTVNGAAFSLASAAAFICETPAFGSRDSSTCTGCCLSGPSSTEAFAAHRASAWAASILICARRCTSACWSAIVGAS